MSQPDLKPRKAIRLRQVIGPITLIFGLVILALVIGPNMVDAGQAELGSLMSEISNSPWIVPAIISMFILGAFLGVPQWVMIGAAIVALGPLRGAGLSYLATLMSASLNFFIGQRVGFARFGVKDQSRTDRLIRRLQRNGFLASLLVRLIPTGPFIIVNLAAGVSAIKYRAFLAGTAIGIIPKIVLIWLISQGLFSGLQGHWGALLFAGLAALILLGSWWLRRLWARRQSPSD